MSKLPRLGEKGGRVNRVGFKRIQLEGTIEKFGFFDEYTQESLDFDNDSELEMHIRRESVKAANEITEDQLQIDLLYAAGVVRYAGTAAATIGIDEDSVVSYDDLVKLGIELDNNRTPKNTKVITGSRMIDTRVVNSARYMYIGSELLPSLMKMDDYHGNQAWIPVAQYGAATTIARGEVGSIADFRIIVVPEMMHWEGAGKVGASTKAYTGPNDAGAEAVNVYPMLVVGDGSFTTIGFQTDGKTVKFKITHKRPGKEIADRHDPYGEVGFYSIKWYYGFMVMRPERIALIKTAAQY
jgi:N4-gp56 family major capsid protein